MKIKFSKCLLCSIFTLCIFLGTLDAQFSSIIDMEFDPAGDKSVESISSACV